MSDSPGKNISKISALSFQQFLAVFYSCLTSGPNIFSLILCPSKVHHYIDRAVLTNLDLVGGWIHIC